MDLDSALAVWFCAIGRVSLVRSSTNRIVLQCTSATRDPRRVAILEILKERFGGSVRSRQNQGRTEYRWAVSGMARVRRFLSLVATVPLPCYKVDQASLIVEYIDWRQQAGRRLSEGDQQIIAGYIQKFQEMGR